MTARNVLDENKRLVTEFYELAINQQKPAEAARKYIEFPYRQHNPEVVDGPDGFVQFISAMQEKHPKLKVVISKVLADDDLVALHVHLTREASDPGLAIAELFRLKNGKIIEHWDVSSLCRQRPLAATRCSDKASQDCGVRLNVDGLNLRLKDR
jgi:predicted SnoaL-like aldol condensation-catalyzing enzyme